MRRKNKNPTLAYVVTLVTYDEDLGRWDSAHRCSLKWITKSDNRLSHQRTLLIEVLEYAYQKTLLQLRKLLTVVQHYAPVGLLGWCCITFQSNASVKVKSSPIATHNNFRAWTLWERSFYQVCHRRWTRTITALEEAQNTCRIVNALHTQVDSASQVGNRFEEWWSSWFPNVARRCRTTGENHGHGLAGCAVQEVILSSWG